MAGWTIEDLGERVAAALDRSDVQPSSKRVRAVPDVRTIRYYGTLGILDGPIAMRGRTALYGTRHALQLLAIKRLQADGKSLVEVQSLLAGAPNSKLAKLSGVSIEALEVEPRVAPRRAEAFWAQSPAEPAPRPERREPITIVHGVRLDRDLTLTFTSKRPLDASDLEAIAEVAAPLVELLITRGLRRGADSNEGQES
ncbi:MAG: MerR family transcriptional regulator [Deltaproteobacteria bacterium]|nr:MerR family transcriptional regulator [Deltaproteobacteria bacterium]